MLGMSYSCWRVMPPCRNTGGQFLKSVTLQCYKSVSNCFIAPLWFKSCRYQNIYQPLIYSQSSRISWTLIPASGENEGCVRWGDDLFRSLLHSDFGYHVYISSISKWGVQIRCYPVIDYWPGYSVWFIKECMPQQWYDIPSGQCLQNLKCHLKINHSSFQLVVRIGT